MSKQEKNVSQDISAAPEAKTTGNLSDDDLDKVAGGIFDRWGNLKTPLAPKTL